MTTCPAIHPEYRLRCSLPIGHNGLHDSGLDTTRDIFRATWTDGYSGAPVFRSRTARTLTRLGRLLLATAATIELIYGA